MTRTVFDNHGVAHAWASRNLVYGRSPNGNFSFEGDVLYSYRTPIARFVDVPSGIKGRAPTTVLLITSGKFSITTTSKHMPALYDAVRGLQLETFRTPFIYNSCQGEGWAAENTAHYYRGRIDDALEGLKTCRVNSLRAEGADGDASRAFRRVMGCVSVYERWCQLFKLDDRETKGYSNTVLTAGGKHVRNKVTRHHVISAADEYEAKLRAKYVPWIRKRAAEIERRDAERKRRQEADAAALAAAMEAEHGGWDMILDDWRRGYVTTGLLGRAIRAFRPQLDSDLVRYDAARGTFCTHRGAEVPFRAAIRLYRAFKAGVVPSGLRVGHFSVSGMRGDQVICIGCHEFTVAEFDAAYEAMPDDVKAEAATIINPAGE